VISLKREIGLFEITSWGVGIILGAGIYVLVGEASGIAGNSVWLSFIIGAMVAALTGLSYAELSSMFPREAAEYIYVKTACGCEILSFIIGWLINFDGNNIGVHSGSGLRRLLPRPLWLPQGFSCGGFDSFVVLRQFLRDKGVD